MQHTDGEDGVHVELAKLVPEMQGKFAASVSEHGSGSPRRERVAGARRVTMGASVNMGLSNLKRVRERT
jgi:hypothetical protein